MSVAVKSRGKSKYAGVFSQQPLGDHIQDYHKNMKNYTENSGAKYPVYLSLEPDEEVEVRFLEQEPVKFHQHRVYDPKLKRDRVFTCTREPDCPLCEGGNKPTFKAAWQVVHIDNLDKNGNVTPRVKLWAQGIRFAELFEKKVRRVDPVTTNVILTRIGAGQNTQYQIDGTKTTGKVKYDKSEVVDLHEYFGIDDEKYEDMCRIGASMQGSAERYVDKQLKGMSRHQDEEEEEYAGPKRGKRSKLEGDIPF